MIVSRNHEIDRVALAAALTQTGAGYIGMIGEAFPTKVYAPLGLDIGADSPAGIAVSTIAEVLAVLRHRTGKNLRLSG